jgi:hypothetical protein
MSFELNCDSKTFKIGNNNYPLTKDILFGDTKDNIILSFSQAFTIDSNKEQKSDVNADRLIKTSVNTIIDKNLIKDMTINTTGSNKPFFNIYTLETNMTKACYAYI